MVELFANSGDPDQTAASDLGPHCLLITLLGVVRSSDIRLFGVYRPTNLHVRPAKSQLSLRICAV